MTFPTINKFVFCLEIETAGVILGWLAAVGFGFLYCLLAAFAMYWWILGDLIFPRPDNETFIEEVIKSLLCH